MTDKELSLGRFFLWLPRALDPQLQLLLCSPREEGPARSELTGKRDLPVRGLLTGMDSHPFNTDQADVGKGSCSPWRAAFMLSVLAVRKMPSACFLPKKIPILEAGHFLPLHFPTLELVVPFVHSKDE